MLFIAMKGLPNSFYRLSWWYCFIKDKHTVNIYEDIVIFVSSFNIYLLNNFCNVLWIIYDCCLPNIFYISYCTLLLLALLGIKFGKLEFILLIYNTFSNWFTSTSCCYFKFSYILVFGIIWWEKDCWNFLLSYVILHYLIFFYLFWLIFEFELVSWLLLIFLGAFYCF